MTPLPPTHEREITAPVDLCTPDGLRLASAARGWSRLPLHRANLRGVWGRTKRWDYWAILTGDAAVSVTYADVDYLGIVSVWWAEFASGRSGGRDVAVPLGRGVSLPDVPGSAPLTWHGRGLDLTVTTDVAGTRLCAAWQERDGTAASLEAHVAMPAAHEALHVVIPWSDTRFQYTAKHQARPARGSLTVDGDTRAFGGDDGEAWGVLDVGRGRWPYRTRWNWAGAAGRTTDGAHVVGLQLGGIWTAGTGFTENGILLDGRLHKIGDELVWEYDWGAPMRPWRVRHPNGSVELELAPHYDRHARQEALVLGTEVHQVFGRWSGTVDLDDGDRLAVDGIPGFAEECRSRW